MSGAPWIVYTVKTYYIFYAILFDKQQQETVFKVVVRWELSFSTKLRRENLKKTYSQTDAEIKSHQGDIRYLLISFERKEHKFL